MSYEIAMIVPVTQSKTVDVIRPFHSNPTVFGAYECYVGEHAAWFSRLGGSGLRDGAGLL
jgi:hypothetical protein